MNLINYEFEFIKYLRNFGEEYKEFRQRSRKI